MTTNMASFFTWLKAKNWVDVPYVPTDVFVNKFIGCIFNKSAALSIYPMSGFSYCWQLSVVNETAISKISRKGSLFGNSSESDPKLKNFWEFLETFPGPFCTICRCFQTF